MSRSLKITLSALVVIALLYVELTSIVQLGRVDTGDTPSVSEASTSEMGAATPRVNSLELQSSRCTHGFSSHSSVSRLTTDGFERLMGNENIEVWLRPDNYDVRVINLRSGYIWGGIEESVTDDMNKSWKSHAGSLITVSYLDKQLSEKTLYMADAKATHSHTVAGDTAMFTVGWDAAHISLSFTLQLDGDSLTIALQDDTIQEDSANPITSVSFLPFFGCARLDEINGYFFLPDGCGALMRFGKGRDYISTYAKKVYGSDLGVENTAVISHIADLTTRTQEFMIPQPEILMPVFGVVHGVKENAFWVRIDSGVPYASILADAATSRLNYHYIRTKYTYRECYIQPTSKSGAGVRTVSKERNSVNPAQTYSFLQGEQADYVGMAVAWRDQLQAKGVLTALEPKQAAPMEINVLAAVRSRGYLGNETLIATTPSDLESIMQDLTKSGVQNIQYAVTGWLKGGEGGYQLGEIAAEDRFASAKELAALSQTARDAGGQLLLCFDPVRMTNDQFTLPVDIATRISQQRLILSKENDTLLFPDTYYRRNRSVTDAMHSMLSYLGENSLMGAAAGVGELLYSDYIKNEETTRAAALTQQQTLAAQSAGMIAAWQTPNAYLWQSVRQAFEMPVEASQYQYITDTVPFLQIVLHGSVDCFGKNLNQDAFSQASLLRLIEYGQYPSFLITQQDNYTLRNSALYDAYSTQYSTWSKDVKSVWQEINAALGPVANALITDHTVIEEGFVRVDYDNGCAVYVNYTLEPRTDADVTVPAQSAVTVGRVGQ